MGKFTLKVLFVSSGNNKFGITPIVHNQGESLRKAGIDVEYFTIKQKGLKGYLSALLELRRLLKNKKFDLIHAHYALSSMMAGLASRIPVIVSLMGSDVHESSWRRILIRFFSRFFWEAVIVKSNLMYTKIKINNAKIIPNGVDLQRLKSMNKETARKKVGFKNNKHILFLSNPSRPEKNYQLAEEAVKFLNNPNVELKAVYDIEYDLIPYYLNSADVLILTSLWEGSPNVIKEAMTCNLPIVSTDVGDVRKIIGNTEGCFICSYDPKNVAEKIKHALNFGKRTNGREKIAHLDSIEIAQEIIKVYKSVLSNY